MKSVTEILDAIQEPEIVAWKLRVGKKKAEETSQEALRIGKAIDKLVQDDINGITVQTHTDPAVLNCWQAWLKFRAKYPDYVSGIEGIQVEVVSGAVKGHPDIVHLREINDIKSGNYLTVRPKNIIQVSKYAVMKGKRRAALLYLSKTEATFLYIWWENEMVDYFGRQVFDAYELISNAQDEAREMTRGFLEKEFENGL